MSSYRELEIYKKAFDLAVRVHRGTFNFPKTETYEIGSQIRRSSMSIKDQIVEGYGRKRYKADFIKFLTYSQASCDETTSQISAVIELYPELKEFREFLIEYEELGKMISSFINYVENNWRT